MAQSKKLSVPKFLLILISHLHFILAEQADSGSNHSSPGVLFACPFYKDKQNDAFCGLKHVAPNTSQWLVIDDNADHTFYGTRTGASMSSVTWRRDPGTMARIATTVPFNPTLDYCLSMWTRRRSVPDLQAGRVPDHLVYLHLYKKLSGSAEVQIGAIEKGDANLLDWWSRQTFSLPKTALEYIVFEVTVDSLRADKTTVHGEIEIDDVSITTGLCPTVKPDFPCTCTFDNFDANPCLVNLQTNYQWVTKTDTNDHTQGGTAPGQYLSVNTANVPNGPAVEAVTTLSFASNTSYCVKFWMSRQGTDYTKRSELIINMTSYDLTITTNTDQLLLRGPFQKESLNATWQQQSITIPAKSRPEAVVFGLVVLKDVSAVPGEISIDDLTVTVGECPVLAVTYPSAIIVTRPTQAGDLERVAGASASYALSVVRLVLVSVIQIVLVTRWCQ